MAVVFDVCFGVAGFLWTLFSVFVLILCTKRKPSQKSHKHTPRDDGNRLTDSAVKLELEAAMKSNNNLGSKPSAMSRESKESNSNFKSSNDNLDADPPISVCKPISMGMSQTSTPSHHKKENPAVSPGPPVSQYVAPTTANSGDGGNKQLESQYMARKDPSVRAKKDMATARAKKDMETARAKKDVESAKAKKKPKEKKLSAETVTKTKSKSH